MWSGHRCVVAHVESHRASIDLDLGALAPRLIGDPHPDPVRAADDVQLRARDRVRPDGILGRGDGPHLEHAIGEHEVDPRRDLEVDLVAGDRHDPGARHVAQDQAAVVGRREIASCRGGRVRLGEGALAEDLGRLAAPVAGSVRDLDDPIAVDDDERVRARDDGVGGVRRPAGDGFDGPDDDVDRHERSDRVVDDHDVVVVRIEAEEAVARALVAGPPAGHDRRRDRQTGTGDHRLGLLEPVRVRDDDQPVDPGGRDRPDAAQKDLLTGKTHELLRHLGPEAVAVTAGQEDRVDSHQSRLPRTR